MSFFQRFLVPAGGGSESVSVLLLLSSLLLLPLPWSSSVAMVLSTFWYLQQDSVHLWHIAVSVDLLACKHSCCYLKVLTHQELVQSVQGAFITSY